MKPAFKGNYMVKKEKRKVYVIYQFSFRENSIYENTNKL